LRAPELVNSSAQLLPLCDVTLGEGTVILTQLGLIGNLGAALKP
jgi:hypothetical protein